MEIFTKKLIELRQEKGISQEKLAEKINVSQSAIAKYEKKGAQPTAENLIKLADYFQVTTDYLLGREDYGTGLIEIKQEPTEWEKKIRDGRSQEEVREITFICEAYIQSEETYKSKIVGYITRCLEEQGKLRY